MASNGAGGRFLKPPLETTNWGYLVLGTWEAPPKRENTPHVSPRARHQVEPPPACGAYHFSACRYGEHSHFGGCSLKIPTIKKKNVRCNPKLWLVICLCLVPHKFQLGNDMLQAKIVGIGEFHVCCRHFEGLDLVRTFGRLGMTGPLCFATAVPSAPFGGSEPP